ncbi:uncharacterized protein LOC129611090 [Condylostylus longicornis]|uniref:uncharacterized protein LOC129611090 n=1 Tax=Condylostylus longicornis TaxID=2530218 RepID=UPI00244E2740|nr:uncharacterized protein LOC129611090 [Condylostylus longicornis]
MDKPTVLIFGGCGFIGRNLVHYLVTNNLCSEIRIVDKTPPQMAYLNKEHSEAFDNPIVEFCSANLINEVSCKTSFVPSKIKNRSWDIVINAASENRPNQSDAVYKEGIFKLSMNCANEAATQNVKRYIELGSGCINSSDKNPLKEDCKLDPWTCLAKYKLKVEKELKLIENLNYTIFRLPIVYGFGDKRYLMPRVIIAALYKYLNETMKLLWNESLKLNTVHINDVVCAIWELAQNEKAVGEVFNIVDDSNTTQGSLSSILTDIFDINIDYWGVVMSNLTKLNMSEAVSDINDKHMGPWAELLQKDGIENTPLTPYMDEELLYHKHLNLDNSKLKKFGYELRHPNITSEKVKEVVEDYVKQNLFPRSLIN